MRGVRHISDVLSAARALRRTVTMLIALAVAGALALVPAPASAAACPSSIDDAIRVSETDGGEETAPGDLARAFPDVPELLAPGAGADDALAIRSIAEVPVTAMLRIAPETTPVENPDRDLRVTITWAGRTVAEGTYRDIVGTSIDLGALAPGARETLAVDVALPAVEERDNDTQKRTWPLRFTLGVGAGGECADDDAQADDRADAASSADSDSGADDTADADADDTANADDTAGAAADADGTDADAAAGGTTSAQAASANDASATSTSDGGGALPRTGLESAGLVALAGIAIGLGAVLIAGARRRRAEKGETTT
ncbi:hypothetical protein [Brevibacterium casei]|uniref:hypothetical protein n=1 Tax=Brevibacterium casei TaxID=33889 RepID=UPI001E3D115B|nr:hypothetical protein [Brevibacterium casei]